MCTLVGKKTSSKVVVIVNTPCCLFVEDLEAINPKISRKNGWEEIAAGAGTGVDLPEWARLTFYKENGNLPKEVLTTRPDGKRLVRLELEEAVQLRYPVKPVATFTYRGRTLHFWDWNRVRALLSYVSDNLRKVSNYPEQERFLKMVPTTFLRAPDRPKVIKKLRKLLEENGELHESIQSS